MIVRFGLLRWNAEETQEISEDELHPSYLSGESNIEGWVRIQADGQPEMYLYDELPILLAHLGCKAPVRCLQQGWNQSSWLLMTQPTRVSVSRSHSGEVVTLRVGAEYAEYPARHFWPAVVAAACRFTDLLAEVWGEEDLRLAAFRSEGSQARDLMQGRGWSLPSPPRSTD